VHIPSQSAYKQHPPPIDATTCKDMTLKHLAQLIAYPQAKIPFGAHDVCTLSGFFWKSWQSFRCEERHILASLGASVMGCFRFVVAPIFLFRFSHPFCIRQQNLSKSANRVFKSK
jgi:hypothetical protein